MANWKTDIGLSLVLLAGGIYLLQYSKGIDEVAAKFPSLIAICTIICALCLIVLAILRRAKEPGREIDLKKHKNVVILMALVIAYGLLMPVLGYIFSSLLGFAAISIFLGYRKPVTIIISDVIVTAAIFVVFKFLLKVPLPTGCFGF